MTINYVEVTVILLMHCDSRYVFLITHYDSRYSCQTRVDKVIKKGVDKSFFVCKKSLLFR